MLMKVLSTPVSNDPFLHDARTESVSVPVPFTQVDAFRRMTMEQRWRVAQKLCAEAREWKACVLRSLHPDWQESEVIAEVRRSFLNAAE